MSTAAWAALDDGARLGKPVPRWPPLALSVVPLVILAAILAAIYSGYDF